MFYFISSCYEKFCKLCGEDPRYEKAQTKTIDEDAFEQSPDFVVKSTFDIRFYLLRILKIRFKSNPFSDRIFKVFCEKSDEMSFEDYLNMMSVFSESAPILLKCAYAFKIYSKFCS